MKIKLRVLTQTLSVHSADASGAAIAVTVTCDCTPVNNLLIDILLDCLRIALGMRTRMG